MGFFDFLRRPPSLLAATTAAAVAATPTTSPETAPKGIPGGGNQSGRLLFEPNEVLRDQSGYGRAGTYNVGQWKEIALSNPYVTAGLDFILGPVADARVDVEPAPPETGVPEAAAKEQAEFLRWALTEHFRLTSHIENAARGFLLSGFALYEPVYALVSRNNAQLSAEEPVADDAAQGRGALPKRRDFWVPASLEQRLPNSLSYNAWLEDDAGRLTAIKQDGPRGPNGEWAQPVLEADKVLLYSWKRDGNNWAGESQLRSTWYIAGRIMPMLLKLSGVTVQREGAGLPVASAKDVDAPDLTDDQRRELMTFFANASFHESSGFVAPKGWELDWVFSTGADKTFIIDLWKALGLVVLQQLGAQQLVLGTDSTGSRSVGEVHDARAMAFVRKVLRFEEAVLNGDSGEAHVGLVRRLIDFNFGPQPAYPRVKLTPQRPEMSPTELTTASKSAKDAGLFTPTCDDENVVRSRLGYAPIDEDERDEAKEKAASLAPPSPFGPGPGAGDSDEKPEPGKKLKASAQRGGWKPWRELRASEKRVPWAKRDAYFTQQRDVFEKLAKPVVMGMLATAAPAIERAMADGNVTPAEVAAINFDTKRLDAMIRGYLADVRKAGQASLAEELKPSVLRAAAEEEDEREDEKQAARDDADEVVEAQADALKRRMVGRLRGELEREAIDTLRTGGGAAEVVQRLVARQYDTGAFKADAGYVTTKAFNVGRDEAARIMGGIESVEYSAVLDSATCLACYRDDGKTAPFNSAEHDALVPPNRDCSGGDNCRCLLIMIPEGDE